MALARRRANMSLWMKLALGCSVVGAAVSCAPGASRDSDLTAMVLVSRSADGDRSERWRLQLAQSSLSVRDGDGMLLTIDNARVSAVSVTTTRTRPTVRQGDETDAAFTYEQVHVSAVLQGTLHGRRMQREAFHADGWTIRGTGQARSESTVVPIGVVLTPFRGSFERGLMQMRRELSQELAAQDGR